MKVNILVVMIRAWIVTDQFTETAGDDVERGVCVGGGGGGQAIIRGSHDFKYFRPSKGGDKSRCGYNSRKYGHLKARLSYPVFILIIALIFLNKQKTKNKTTTTTKKNLAIFIVPIQYQNDEKLFWVSFAVYCDIILRALLPSIAS